MPKQENHPEQPKPFVERDEMNQSPITLSGEEFDHFVEACDNAQNPNTSLQEALSFTKSHEVD